MVHVVRVFSAGGEPCDQVNRGHMCRSPVFHQVELLEALLNYYTLNTLYSEINGKYHYGFLQVKSGHCFGGGGGGGERTGLGVGKQGSPAGCETLGEPLPYKLTGLSLQWEW